MGKDPRLARAGVCCFNKVKRTPQHPKKSHVVVAKVGNKTKLIRFGQQGVVGAGRHPKSERDKKRRKSFYKRHKRNIERGNLVQPIGQQKQNGDIYLYIK